MPCSEKKIKTTNGEDDEMMAAASLSLIDGAISALTHCVTLSIEASRYTVFGVQDESSAELVGMNVDSDLNVVLTFLETEKDAIKAYRPAHACSECIQNTTKLIRRCLDEITRKIHEHQHMVMRHWYSSGCEEDLKRLRTLMDALSKDFRLLLQIMSVRR